VDIFSGPCIGEKVPRILGAEFREKSIHASIADVRFRSVKPVRSLEVSLPEEGQKDFIVETLKEWNQEYSLNKVVIGLPIKRFLHHVIEMPVMNHADLRRALSFELEKFFPLPVEEYLFDFISTPLDKNRLKVFVLSIKREFIYELINLVKSSKLEVLSVRCSSLEAFSRFLDSSEEKGGGLFINIVEDGYEVIGFEQATPLMIKTFPGNADMDFEILKMIDTHSGQVVYMGKPDLLLTGETKGRKLNIQVPDALTLAQTIKSRVSLNFIPQELAEKRKDYYPYLLGGIAAATVLLFLLTGIVTYFKNASTLNSIEAKIASIKDRAAGELEAHKKLELLQTDRKVLLDLKKRSNITIKALSDLSSILPVNAWLIKISIDHSGKVEMEGFATKTSGLVAALENSRSFRNVSFSSPIIAKGGEERFSIKMEVEWP
jgi:Tfp pilus assembly protein PilN